MVSLIDMGGRLRMIIQDIEVIKPILEMPNLPVARVMWKPAPDLLTGVKCWIEAGGAHHSARSWGTPSQTSTKGEKWTGGTARRVEIFTLYQPRKVSTCLRPTPVRVLTIYVTYPHLSTSTYTCR